MIRTAALLVLAGTLTGCSTLNLDLENRIACTVDQSQAMVVSLYGPIGIASKIAKADAVVVCKQK